MSDHPLLTRADRWSKVGLAAVILGGLFVAADSLGLGTDALDHELRSYAIDGLRTVGVILVIVQVGVRIRRGQDRLNDATIGAAYESGYEDGLRSPARAAAERLRRQRV